MSPAADSVAVLRRYPVKSMLGEALRAVAVGTGGVDGDRSWALLDVSTGRVATAKHPRLWRVLLRFSASTAAGGVLISLPDGQVLRAGDDGLDEVLSAALGRPVQLRDERPAGAAVERPAPEDVLAHGVEAEVPFDTLEIAQGTPGASFVDYAPVHLITTATLHAIGTDAVRFRPNVVVTSAGEPFAENDWVGREIRVGDVRLRGTLPTPRCAVPTLEHGDLPAAPRALRHLLATNRVDVPGFGVLPCAGVYAEVVRGGTLREGDEVEVAPRR